MANSYETVWTFRTARFRVELQIYPEDTDPADLFELQEDIDAVRDGNVEWFWAHVAIYGQNDELLGYDSLGACAYRTVREFYTSHRDADPMNRNCSIMRAARGRNVSICHYFPDMVRQAVASARQTIEQQRNIYANIHA